MSITAIELWSIIWKIDNMSVNELMAEIKRLPAVEQQKLARMLVEETDWLEDVVDAAITKSRIQEPERPVEMLLREQGLLE